MFDYEKGYSTLKKNYNQRRDFSNVAVILLLRYNILVTLYIFHMNSITIQGAFVFQKSQ